MSFIGDAYGVCSDRYGGKNFLVYWEHTAATNAAFDEYLRAENQQWGVRNLDDVVAVAKAKTNANYMAGTVQISPKPSYINAIYRVFKN